jgi:diguanylate cyclase (GGDEF)-like protein
MTVKPFSSYWQRLNNERFFQLPDYSALFPIQYIFHAAETDLMQNRQTEHRTSALRLRFLTPLVSVIILMILILAVSLFYNESENSSHIQIEKRLHQTRTTASSIFQESTNNDANALLGMLAVLAKDQRLASLFEKHQRDELYQHTETLFNNLNHHYKITHFYFIKPDKSVLLRVHAPARHGDVIARVTTTMAAETLRPAQGLELGVLGTFTLRVVKPWYDPSGKKLIGFIELGMEIDHIIEDIKKIFAMETHVVIYKQFLDRQRWQQGSEALGRIVDWDQFDQVVITTLDAKKITPVLREHLVEGDHRHVHDSFQLKTQEKLYRLISIPLKDINQNEVGQLLMMANITPEIEVTRTIVLVVGGSTLFFGLILIVFFSWQAKRISQFIQEDERKLKELATVDSLTGLYTRRVFDEFLDSELIRASRFKHNLSLLLVDIDHFKQINDTHGHQAGDIVLRKVAERIRKEARAVDRVCRYGGEEIGIILPETSINDAEKFGWRLNKLISTFPFIANEETIDLTVSIGVAAFPNHGDNETFMISAADRALYKAKETGRNRVCVHENGQDFESS